MVDLILGLSIGLSLTAGIILGSCVCYMKQALQSQSQQDLEAPSEDKLKFRGIASRPSFKAAIQKSFQSTTNNTTAILHSADTYFDTSVYTYMECHTCALIAEGSSMAYSDDTCPQCGRNTSHLTDSSINHYA